MKTDAIDCIFPCGVHPGLTKREYFAAMALQGCIPWDAIVNKAHETAKPDDLARSSVLMADALIRELNKK